MHMASNTDRRAANDTDAPPLPTWLTVGEIASSLQLSDRTIRRLIHTGELAAVCTPGRRGRMRVSQQALRDFLARSAVRAEGR